MRAIFFPLEGILIKTHFSIPSGFAAVGMVGAQIKARKSSSVNRPLRVDLSTQNLKQTSDIFFLEYGGIFRLENESEKYF